MGFHLRTEPKDKAAAREALEVPGEHRRDHRAAWEGDGDGGVDLDARGVLSRDGAGEKGVVRRFREFDRVEAQAFRAPAIAAAVESKSPFAPLIETPTVNAIDPGPQARKTSGSPNSARRVGGWLPSMSVKP